MKQPLRVLQVISGMGSGGAEAFLMNMYRNVDRSKVQFDFLLRSDENIYEDEINKLGGKIYYTASFPKHYLKNKYQVRSILKNNQYEVVHVHANALFYMTALTEAKRAGVPCRIMHSHSTAPLYSWSVPIHTFNQKRIEKLTTYKFACSMGAAQWMFGKQCMVIKNAIDLEKFQYDEAARKAVRKELNISDDTFVLGHVGRFLPVKNHQFILDVFSEIVRQRENSALVLVGTGKLLSEIQRQAEQKGIAEKVLFLGVRKDVNRVLNAFDIFIFPSLYEGLGISAIESQANGLYTFCSENIPSEVYTTSLAQCLNISAGFQYWAEQILSSDTAHIDNLKKLRESGYDIREEAQRLQNIYLSQTGRL